MSTTLAHAVRASSGAPMMTPASSAHLAIHALELRRAATRGEAVTVAPGDALPLVDAIDALFALAERAATLAHAVDVQLERRARHRRRTPAPVLPASLEGVSDDVFIECMGPSWSAMKPKDREAYGPVASPRAMAAAKMANMKSGTRTDLAPRGARLTDGDAPRQPAEVPTRSRVDPWRDVPRVPPRRLALAP